MAGKRSSVRVACGSGYADDRIELAEDVIRRAHPEFVCMDGLAERTLALAHLRRLEDVDTGFDTRLESFASRLLPAAAEERVRIVTNMGAASPAEAGEFLAHRAKEMGLSDMKIGVVMGDDVRSYVEQHDPLVLETGRLVSELTGTMVSANTYIGCDPIVDALEQGADVVIGGRLADPSLYVGALAYAFGWSLDDWAHLGAATAVGHLLECGCYVTGGNFADPPYRVVPSFRKPGLPFADVDADGTALIQKTPGTDGLLSVETCKMQLGYEIHDPGNYITPDITADFRNVTLRAEGDGVRVGGAVGGPRPEQLKVLIGVDEGFVGEGQVSFAGPGALSRARLAEDIARERIAEIGERGVIEDLRVDLLGLDGLHGSLSPAVEDPYEVHLRISVRTPDKALAAAVAHAVEYIQVFGPAGTAGHRRSVRPQLTMFSVFVPRADVPLSAEIV